MALSRLSRSLRQAEILHAEPAVRILERSRCSGGFRASDSAFAAAIAAISVELSGIEVVIVPVKSAGTPGPLSVEVPAADAGNTPDVD